MKRWMAIDYGTKRIGIALTDMLKYTSQPYTTIQQTGRKEVIGRIRHIADEMEVEKIIVGLPMNMDGTESVMSQSARKFADELIKEIHIPVDMWDERLSSAFAENILIEEADMSRKKRKKVRDKLAACLILQSYLESNKP